MKLFQRNEDVVDYGATLHEWPKKIWAEEEIPLVYRPYLQPLLDAGMKLDALVWVPAKGYIRNSYEYMAARTAQGILLLYPGEKDTMKQVQFESSQVVYVRNREYMLNCRLEFDYIEKDQCKTALMPYNKATQAMFLPFLNESLGLPGNYSLQEAMKCHPRPEHLLHEEHALYSYCEDAYRLGDEIQEYYWGKSHMYAKGIFFRKRRECAWILCEMERGCCLVEYGQDYHETLFLPKHRGAAQWNQEKSSISLELFTERGTSTVKELIYDSFRKGQEEFTQTLGRGGQ